MNDLNLCGKMLYNDDAIHAVFLVWEAGCLQHTITVKKCQRKL